jgi:WD40 repeat protein
MIPLPGSPFKSSPPRKGKQTLSVSPSGAICVVSDRICTVYLDNDSSLEPLYVFTPFSGPISQAAWCQGPNPSDETPLDLLLCDFDGNVLVTNVVRRETVAAFSLTPCQITAVEWAHDASDRAFFGANDGSLRLYQVSPTDLLWSADLDFAVNFIRISPFDDRRVVVANAYGSFSVVTVNSNDYLSAGVVMPPKNLVDISFHPFFSSAIILVFDFSICLFWLDTQSIVPVCPGTNSNDLLVTAAFPDRRNEGATLLVYQTHGQFFRTRDENPQHIKYLRPFNANADQPIAAVYANNFLYILGADLTVQLFQLRSGAFWAVRITRPLPPKPSCFSAADSTVFFAAGQMVTVEAKKFYQICDSPISNLVAISPEVLIASTVANGHPRVFLANFKDAVVRAVLRQSLEILASRVEVSVSLSREFVAVLLDSSILAIYHLENDLSLLKIEILEVNGNAIGTFSENSREFWIVDRTFCGQKYQIRVGDAEQVYKSRICRLGRANRLGAPVVCDSACNKLLIGTDIGSLVICDWLGQAPVACEVSHKPITMLSLSPDHTHCVVVDAEGQVALVNVESAQITRFSVRSTFLKFLDSTTLIDISELTHRNTVTFDSIMRDASPHLQDHLALKSLEERKQILFGCIEKAELAILARKCQFPFLAELFECQDSEIYVPACFGANLSSKRICQHLEHENLLLEQLNELPVRRRRTRNFLIQNDPQSAFGLLISTPSDSAEFALEVVKAAFAHKAMARESAPSVAALVSAGKVEDAVDIVLLTQQFREAARLLLGEGKVEQAIQIMTAQLDEQEIASMVDFVESTLVAAGNHRTAYALLMAWRRVSSVAKLLVGKHSEFAVAVLEQLDGKLGRR